MVELTNYNTLKTILQKNGFNFKKSLGQNFLIDDTVCPRMAQLCGCENIGVIEIGPGAGVLTQQLAQKAKKVVCIEIDTNLRNVLNETLSDFNNVKVIFGDCMKLDIQKIIDDEFGDMDVVVCANLPYYLTSPIIMSLLESNLSVKSITVMVQKEAGQRLCAQMGNRECSAVTAAVRYYSTPSQLFTVSNTSFFPPPKVESEVIKLDIREHQGFGENDKKTFFKLIKAAFSMRRKTLINCLSKNLSIEKQTLTDLFKKSQIDLNARAENVTIEQYVMLADYIYQEV